MKTLTPSNIRNNFFVNSSTILKVLPKPIFGLINVLFLYIVICSYFFIR